MTGVDDDGGEADAWGNNVIDFAQQKKLADLAALHKKLRRMSEGGPAVACLANTITVLRDDPALAGIVAYDEFAGKAVITRSPPLLRRGDPVDSGPFPRTWKNADVTMIRKHVQNAFIPNAVKTDIEDAMEALAPVNRFHPVRDYLDGLLWDGVARLNRWLWWTYGVDAVDEDMNAYHDEVAAAFMIGAVRRIRDPGCKVENMLILEGEQGIGKSQSLRVLFSPWFSDSLPAKLDSKDAVQGLLGRWCLEFAEIEQMIRSDVEVIKAFLSRQVDEIRLPYAKAVSDFPRQCVLVGTTNGDDYLRDATGNRRFWPVKCRMVDLEWLAANRDQLWAEASAREAAGEQHWLRSKAPLRAAKQIQDERVETDLWEEDVAAFVAGKSSVRMRDIIDAVVGVEVSKRDRILERRLAKILRRLGYQRRTRRESGNGQVFKGWVLDRKDECWTD